MADPLAMLGIVLAGVAIWGIWTKVLWPRIEAGLSGTTPEHDDAETSAEDWPDRGMW